MSVIDLVRAINKIETAFLPYIPIRNLIISGGLGKIYEIYALSFFMEELKINEGVNFSFVPGIASRTKFKFRSGGGPIDIDYPHFDVYNNSGQIIGELWTDIEFQTFSYSWNSPITKNVDRCHELDLVLVTPNVRGYPLYSNIAIGIECKDTKVDKKILKQILGVRREMGTLVFNVPIKIMNNWPVTHVNNSHGSLMICYSSNVNPNDFDNVSSVYSIKFEQLRP